jgi:hypothetical protein
MALTPKYFYINAAPTNVKSGGLQQYAQPNAKSGVFNPIFNLNQDFVNRLQSITSIEMGQSIPHISLKRLDENGVIKDDFNLEFFTKQIDFEGMRAPNSRFSDRPIMSLKDITISTDQASGWMYYTKVTLALKIHSPYALMNESIQAMLIPNLPLLLEYGWNSPNELLNKKEVLLFSPYNYQLSMDVTGQIDLTVEAMAFHEQFNNTLVGDEKDVLVPSEYFNEGQGSISDKFLKLKDHIKYLNGLKTKKGTVDYKNVQDQLQSFSPTAELAKGIIGETFRNNLDQLKANSHKRSENRNGPNQEKLDPLNYEAFTFHDVLFFLCDKTFKNLTNIIPGAKELRIVYGNANDNAGRYKSVSLADFPIRKDEFYKMLSKEAGKGNPVLTIQKLLNNIIDKFFNNKQYWNHDLSAADLKSFDMPQVVCTLINYREGKDVIMELQIIDAKSGIPQTSKLMPTGPGPENAVEQKLKQVDPNLPILKLGSAGSFFKSVTFNQVSDEHMKAVLINRMQSTAIDFNIPVKSINQSKPQTPLQLPLKGTISVVGQVDWKPFRSFYLDAGLYLVNGVYKIQSVVHKLSHQGFDTTIEILYH